jgi:hypothetical protein
MVHTVTIRPSDSFRRRARRRAPPFASPFPFETFQLFLLLLRLDPIAVGALLISVRFEGRFSQLVA